MITKFLNYFSPNILWRMQDDNIYLTFDDGPDTAITPKLLDLLQKHNIKATFFLLGQKVERFPDIVLEIQKNDHTIGNHSYSHPIMLAKSKREIIYELDKTDETLFKITGEMPRLFRPPHGIFGVNLLSVLNITKHKMVLWGASVGDFRKQATCNAIKNRLSKIAKHGDIILLHDGHPNSKNTLTALEKVLDWLKERGINFSAIPENLV